MPKSFSDMRKRRKAKNRSSLPLCDKNITFCYGKRADKVLTLWRLIDLSFSYEKKKTDKLSNRGQWWTFNHPNTKADVGLFGVFPWTCRIWYVGARKIRKSKKGRRKNVIIICLSLTLLACVIKNRLWKLYFNKNKWYNTDKTSYLKSIEKICN